MNRAKKNYLYQVTYQILILIIPLVTAPYVTRVLGADNLGIYTYTQTIATVFYTIARLGIVNNGNRCIAENQNNIVNRSRVFWEIFTIQAASTIIITIVYATYVMLYIKENKAIAIVQLLYVFSSFFDIAWFYMGMENFKKTVARGAFVKILSIVLLFSLVRDSNDTFIYALIVIGSTLIGHLTLWFGIKKYLIWVKPKLDGIKNQIKPTLVLFIPFIAVTLYTRMDKIMLGTMSGVNQVAFYEYAAKLVVVPLSFITTFGSVMLPNVTASIAAGEAKEKMLRKIQKSLFFVMFLSSAFAFGMAAVSNVFIPIYYSEEFSPCIILLALLAIKLPFMAWANVIRTQCLIPNHRDKEYIVSLFIGAFVNLILNYFLIKAYAANGAAIATIIAEVTVCVIQTSFVKKDLPVFKLMRKCSGFIVIGVIMYSLVQLINPILSFNSIIKLLIEVLLGGLIYLILSYVYYCKRLTQTTLNKGYKILFGGFNKKNNK